MSLKITTNGRRDRGWIYHSMVGGAAPIGGALLGLAMGVPILMACIFAAGTVAVLFLRELVQAWDRVRARYQPENLDTVWAETNHAEWRRPAVVAAIMLALVILVLLVLR